MDPKVYLPLLESFEKICRGFERSEKCLQFCLMNFNINIHLKKCFSSIDWGFKFLGIVLYLFLV
jgi:hypothetical protein